MEPGASVVRRKKCSTGKWLRSGSEVGQSRVGEEARGPELCERRKEGRPCLHSAALALEGMRVYFELNMSEHGLDTDSCCSE